MITVATLFWQANAKSLPFSSMYDEVWVEKLYRGFARNLTRPFRFVCYVDRVRDFGEPIQQRLIASSTPGYADCIQPFEMGVPMILCGLDTVITGNIDHLADYCLTADRMALPRDPYMPSRSCNGVCLVPAGWESIALDHRGENDMEWLRLRPHAFIDDLFPGDVVSYKGSVEKNGLRNAKVVYFHGLKKPHELSHLPWVQENWR